jgi:uncharacterized protein (DUF2147 family)
MMSFLIAAAAVAGSGGADVTGRWKTETRNGIVEIETCGQSVCGRLLTSDGLKANPNLTDANNRDKALRQRPLRNLQILGGFKASGREWAGGTIYNAEDGKTYGAKLTLVDTDTLNVRGCIFVPLCKTQTWKRVR